MSDPVLTRQELRKLREAEGERKQQEKLSDGHWRAYKEKPSRTPDERVAEKVREDYAPKDYSNADIDRALENAEPVSASRATRRAELERDNPEHKTAGFSDDDLEDLQLSRADIEHLKQRLAESEATKKGGGSRDGQGGRAQNQYGQGQFQGQNQYGQGQSQGQGQNQYGQGQQNNQYGADQYGKPVQPTNKKKKNKFRDRDESRTGEGEKSRERNHALNIAIVIVGALLAVLIYLVFNW